MHNDAVIFILEFFVPLHGLGFRGLNFSLKITTNQLIKMPSYTEHFDFPTPSRGYIYMNGQFHPPFNEKSGFEISKYTDPLKFDLEQSEPKKCSNKVLFPQFHSLSTCSRLKRSPAICCCQSCQASTKALGTVR